MFRATALVYSSHNRCEYIHRYWIVERALQSHHNKTVLYLPMSMGEDHQQEYSWGTFRWYFDRFRQWGLEPRNFYWNDDMSQEDVALLFDWLINSEVVILGGGSSTLGMQRYSALGAYYFGDPGLFGRILHQRQNHGKLTVGFSAGADQLCQYLAAAMSHYVDAPEGYGLARNVVTTLHHEWGQENTLRYGAERYPECMVFGLPNDSGLAVDQGFLPSGNIWQVIEFLIDKSWDLPNDAWHIKTRSGMNIDHFYSDGRQWTFHGGDRMVRVMSPDNHYQDAWILPVNGPILDYWSQRDSGYDSAEEILASH